MCKNFMVIRHSIKELLLISEKQGYAADEMHSNTNLFEGIPSEEYSQLYKILNTFFRQNLNELRLNNGCMHKMSISSVVKNSVLVRKKKKNLKYV